MEREYSDIACPEWNNTDWSTELCSKCGKNSLFAFPRDMKNENFALVHDYRTFMFNMDVYIEPGSTAFCYTNIHIPKNLGKYLVNTGELPNEQVSMEELGNFYLQWYEEEDSIVCFVYQVPLDDKLSREEINIFSDPKFACKSLATIKEWMEKVNLFPIPNYIQKELKKGYKVFAETIIDKTT